MMPNQNMVSDQISWDLKPEQVIAIVSTLGVLVVFYTSVVYYAGKNCYDFLYKKGKYENYLLTAFYIMAIATCTCRITQYVYLVSMYFESGE